MRGSICVAAGLLATNIALLQRPAPAATPRITSEAPRVARVASETAETQRLRWFWQAKHNGLHLPACDHFDPLAVLDADVDATPGHEHVIGNRQFGVMMFDAQGTLLAHMDPVGCADASSEDQSLSLSVASIGRLAIHTRTMHADGEHLAASITERKDDELQKLLDLDTGGDRTGWEVDARIVMGSDSLEVIYHGRLRTSPERAWETVDEHCEWQLATRTFSCRTRAGGRTRGSE